jgi:hypothetical protein
VLERGDGHGGKSTRKCVRTEGVSPGQSHFSGVSAGTPTEASTPAQGDNRADQPGPCPGTDSDHVFREIKDLLPRERPGARTDRPPTSPRKGREVRDGAGAPPQPPAKGAGVSGPGARPPRARS